MAGIFGLLLEFLQTSQTTNHSISFRMAKDKLTLDDLHVQSLVTSLNEEQMNQLKGGTAPVRGRRFTYRTRWTVVDVRSDMPESVGFSGTNLK